MARESANSEALNPDSLSPYKRLKTQTKCSSISKSSKGKAPLEEPKDEISTREESPSYTQSQNCGICLSEEGKSVRGYIDSCDHYFCFLCIIEWSRIESRCPLCRARFTTIQRMRRDGTFIGNRPVSVPIRDQISDPLGNFTAGLDPYAQAKCSTCNGSADENLTLLCDLCDSAAHTYCVGLGWTVPEGNWYCEGCCLLRAEELNFEADCNDAEASVSVFDIVRDNQEPNSNETERLLNLSSRKNWSLSSTSNFSKPESGTIDIQRNTDPKLSEMGSGVRTLHRCRNVHIHIRALRENWDAFRRGSLSFSSQLPNAIDRSSLEVTDGLVFHGVSRAPESSSSRASQSTQDGPSSVAMHGKCSYNVDRAWKMLELARSMQQVQKQKSSFPASSKNISGSVCVQTDSSNRNAKLNRGKCGSRTTPLSMGSKIHHLSRKHCSYKSQMCELQQKSGQTDSSNRNAKLNRGKCGSRTTPLSMGSKIHHLSRKHCSYKSQMCELQQKSGIILEGATNSSLLSSPGKFKLKHTRKPPALVPTDAYHERDGEPSQKMVDRVFPFISNGQDQLSCSTIPVESETGASDASATVLSMNTLSTRGLKSSEAKFRAENACSESKINRDDGAKGEIASLVKVNLKILSKHKKLGADVYKEIARLSTHTILAACGLEHRKTAYSFPAAVCSHGDQTKQLSRSHLMPNTCRECFYCFVKDVVSSIMREKLSCS